MFPVPRPWLSYFSLGLFNNYVILFVPLQPTLLLWYEYLIWFWHEYFLENHFRNLLNEEFISPILFQTSTTKSESWWKGSKIKYSPLIYFARFWTWVRLVVISFYQGRTMTERPQNMVRWSALFCQIWFITPFSTNWYFSKCHIYKISKTYFHINTNHSFLEIIQNNTYYQKRSEILAHVKDLANGQIHILLSSFFYEKDRKVGLGFV